MSGSCCASWGLLVGRVLLGQIFFISGVMKLMNWSKTVDLMTSEGMVAVPLLLAGALLVEIGGGLGVLLGWFTRCSALTLAAFLIPTTLIFHDFWVREGMEAMNQMQHFMKNVTIMGGLVTLAAAGPGRFAVDAVMSRGRPERQYADEELTEALSR